MNSLHISILQLQWELSSAPAGFFECIARNWTLGEEDRSLCSNWMHRWFVIQPHQWWNFGHGWFSWMEIRYTNRRFWENLHGFWGVLQMGVPQYGWLIMEKSFKMHDWGIPPFHESTIREMFSCHVGWSEGTHLHHSTSRAVDSHYEHWNAW